MSNKSPILFLIFNRPAETKEVFEQIRKYQPEKLYIGADGARESKKGEGERVEEARKEVLDNIDWPCEVITLFHQENLGCGKAVTSALKWFFDHEEMGIIIEDDCKPNEQFFKFCSEMLHHYKDIPEITHVTGYNPFGCNVDSNTYLFSRYSRIWGWAGWRKSWEMYDYHLKTWPEVKKNKEHLKKLPYLEAKIREYYWDMSINKTISAWGPQWFYSQLFNNGTCIIPEANMVVNIGMHEDSTHFQDTINPFPKLAYGKTLFPLIHPKSIAYNKSYDRQNSNHYIKIKIRAFIYKKIRALFL